MRVVPVAAGFAIVLLAVIAAADTGRLGPLQVMYSFQYGDKAGHFVLLGTLALLVDLALLQVMPKSRPQTLVLAGSSVIAALISLEELSQLWVPTRNPDWFDLLASYAGVVAGTLAAFALRDLVRPRRAHNDAPGNTA
jgi:VanZ family protein